MEIVLLLLIIVLIFLLKNSIDKNAQLNAEVLHTIHSLKKEIGYLKKKKLRFWIVSQRLKLNLNLFINP